MTEKFLIAWFSFFSGMALMTYISMKAEDYRPRSKTTGWGINFIVFLMITILIILI